MGIIFLAHLIAICEALFMAWLLRFDFTLPYPRLLFSALPILVMVRLAVPSGTRWRPRSRSRLP